MTDKLDLVVQRVDDMKGDIQRLEEKVDESVRTTGEFHLDITRAITELQKVQADCPIRAVEQQATKASFLARGAAWVVAIALTAVLGAAAAALWTNGGH